MLLRLQKGIIYGPVNSRRLGSSLGINILSVNEKFCPFNCVYCQYGWTKNQTIQPDNIFALPSVRDVKEALREALMRMSRRPAYITFSGNGEPTLHPDFAQIVEEVKAARDELSAEAKTAILSNSAFVSDLSVRQALSRLDVRIMKLDCGETEVFKRYNQPCRGVDLEAITDGLARLTDVTIQALFSSGQEGNLSPQNIIAWIERLKRINPSSVQLYTLDRGYPGNDLKPTAEEQLRQIKKLVGEAGLSAQVY
jgi:wyosine [tRNA(Phe)-imidazoG37] synthetase (radical SAM superfamily)